MNRILLSLILILALFFPSSLAQCDISGVSIMAILVDPNGSMNNYDTDGDGTASTDDEFIEICNNSATPVDISGWTIEDAGGSAFIFPSDPVTTLSAGECVTVVRDYDGGTPPAGVFDMNNGSGWFNNEGDSIILSNGTNYCSVVYNSGFDCGTNLCDGITMVNCCEDYGTDADGCPLVGGMVMCSYIPSGIILPVILSSFDGSSEANYNLLTWTTSYEYGNSHFIVEHSRDGLHFEPVQDLNAKGVENSNYTYQHHTTQAGSHYYQIVSVDLDGTKSPSPILHLDRDACNDFKIYPTILGDGSFQINWKNLIHPSEISIYTLNGAEVFAIKTEGTSSVTLDANLLPEGMLWVEVRGATDQRIGRVIKR